MTTDATIQERFERFHADYPTVYATLVRLARRLCERGYQRLAIGMLWEVVRYETMLGAPDAEFRLNDHYRSRYARLIMDQEPDLDGMFEIRLLRSA